MPYPSWVRQEGGAPWTPNGTIEGILSTDEMRAKAAEALEQVKQIEIEAYKIMEELVGEAT